MTITEEAARVLAERRWDRDVPWAAHAHHGFHGACAVCRGDLPQMMAALAAAGLLREDPAPIVSASSWSTMQGAAAAWPKPPATDDPIAGVKAGDPDPTTEMTDPCGVVTYDRFGHLTCHREPGHPGVHITGDGETVVAVFRVGGES